MSVVHILLGLAMRSVNAASPEQPYPNIALGFDGANPEHLCLRCPIVGTVPEGTLVRVEHKLSGASTWRQGPFLSRIRLADLGTLPAAVVGNVADSFVGMAFAVATASTSATVLDVRLAVYPPSSATQYVTGTHTMRALAAAAPAITHTCTPANFASVLASLPHQSGTDVHLRMGAGTYTWSALAWAKGGTLAKPIYVSAAALGDVVINTASGACLLPQASHVVFERLRFNGSGSDSGVSATSEWMQIPGGSPTYTNWSVRDCEVLGFDRGAVSFTPVQGFDIRRTKFIGNNPWSAAFQPNGFGSTGNNATWNDHGICLPGLGNSATNCEIKGHGDSWRTYASSSFKQFTAGCGMTRCDIRNSGDDMAEFDGTAGNSYAFECRGVNVGNGISADDTYGPAFVVKCLIVNPSRGPLKLTSNSFGTRVLSCTFVMTVKGPDDHGMLTPAGGTQDGFELINCAVRYAGAGNALYWSSGLARDKWANNAWFPDRGFYINGVGTYANLAAAKAGNAARFANDVLLGASPFVDAITLGANCTTEYTGTPTGEISAGNPARAAGVAIAGITDGFSGAAPDIGAFISGQAAVLYGVPTLPSWVPSSSGSVANVSALTVANGGLTNNFIDITAPNYATFWHHYIVDAYSGGAYNGDYGPYGAMMLHGGGHSGTNDNTLAALVYGATQLSFKRVIDPSPTYDAHLSGGGASPTLTLDQVKDYNSAGNYDHTPGSAQALGIARVDPSTASQLVDGKPSAPHSYGFSAVIPAAYGGAACGTFIAPGILAANYNTLINTGSITSYTAALASTSTPSSSQAWQQRFRHPTYPDAATNAVLLQAAAPAALHAEFDTVTARVVWQCPGKPVRWIDHNASTATDWFRESSGAAMDASNMGTASHRLVLVPERNLLVWVYRKNSTGTLGIKYAVNGANPSWVSADPPLSANIAVGAHWSCATWCADSPGGGRIIVGDLAGNNAQCLEIAIPATLTDTWTFELVSFSAALPFITPATADNGSIYGRWKYVQNLKCIPVLLSGAEPSTVYAIRPRGV